MPYCPKCDMEFIDGITACTDCGGALAESKEAADAMRKQAQKEAAARRLAEYEELTSGGDEAIPVPSEDDQLEEMEKAVRAHVRPRIYVKKTEQYEDLKSSASAFVLVGGILLVFSILCWAKVIRLPLSEISRIISQTVMTVLGIASLVVAAYSAKSANAVKGQIAEEEEATRQLIDWFTGSYTGEQLDTQIQAESGELVPEELSLKRFELIQDILITTHDISDQAYVDSVAEDIYGKMYQD